MLILSFQLMYVSSISLFMVLNRPHEHGTPGSPCSFNSLVLLHQRLTHPSSFESLPPRHYMSLFMSMMSLLQVQIPLKLQLLSPPCRVHLLSKTWVLFITSLVLRFFTLKLASSYPSRSISLISCKPQNLMVSNLFLLHCHQTLNSLSSPAPRSKMLLSIVA